MNDEQTKIESAAGALRAAKRVAVLTGAGISAESGVPTFRASDGLWEGHRIEDVATPDGWRRDPKLVWKFYNERRVNVSKVQPNAGHFALAEMEKRWGDDFHIVTQNVDGLHMRAGNNNVYEIHGSLSRTLCLGCGDIRERGLEHLGESPLCPLCDGRLRPNIVWFNENLPEDVWSAAQDAVEQCNVLLVIGTSAVVYPAAGLIPLAKRAAEWGRKDAPATVIEINLTPTDASHLVDIGLYGKSGEILPRILALI